MLDPFYRTARLQCTSGGVSTAVRICFLNRFPELLEDSEGGPGTMTWVDPADLTPSTLGSDGVPYCV